MKSNKVTELFFLVVGCIAMGLYTAMLFEWIDCADWFILPSKFISGQYEQAKAFTRGEGGAAPEQVVICIVTSSNRIIIK